MRWRNLCTSSGEDAPGPFPALRVIKPWAPTYPTLDIQYGDGGGLYRRCTGLSIVVMPENAEGRTGKLRGTNYRFERLYIAGIFA